MKKATIVLLIIISLLLSGCSIDPKIAKKYTYYGESENWTGEYELDYIVDFPIEDEIVYAQRRENRTLIVSYKGELSDLSDVKQLEISYKHGSGGGSLTESHSSPPHRKDFRLGGGSGSKHEIGEYPVSSERMQGLYKMYGLYNNGVEKIEVSIDLDGKIENMELLIGEEDKQNSLQFEQIKESLSKMRHNDQQLAHINTKVDLDLISSNKTIKDEKNVTYEEGMSEDDNEGQEFVSEVLYYDFTVKNIGSRKVGRISNADDLQIQIEPNEKLKEVSEEIFGFNIFDYDPHSNTGLGYGQSIDYDFLNNNVESKITLTFDLGVSEGGPPGTPAAPTADKLEKLQYYASEASLVITYKDKEIAQFNLNENK